MAYNPISGFTLQIVTQAGEVASDYYLKFYEANTTTPLSMATDSAGGTLLVKAKLSDSGFPISNPLDNSTVFIPHMNANYRMVVYTNETDADANNTAAAYVNIPFVSTLVGASAVGTAAYLDTGTAAGELPTNGDLPTFGGSASSDVPTNADLAPYLGRNLIINGDFSVWQRGTSTFSTDEAHTADRWLLSKSGGTSTIDQGTHTLGQTDVPGNPAHFLDLDVTTGNNYSGVTYRVEGVRTASNTEATLSFYAKGVSPAGGTIGIRYDQGFGTGGSPSSSVSGDIDNTLVLSSGWQRFEVTFTLPSVAGKTLGTNGDDYLQLRISQGPDTATDAWNMQLSNVQLEFGNKATDFEYVDPATQLARCQRYYVRFDSTVGDSVGAIGSVFNTNAGFTVHSFPTTMRGDVTLSISSAADFDYFQNAAVITGASSVVLGNSSRYAAELNHGATLTINQPFFFRCEGGWYAFDAEL